MDTIVYRLITEVLQNYALKLDAPDIEDGAHLGYNDQTFNVFWKSDISFFLGILRIAGSTLPGYKEVLYMLQFHALENHCRNRN